MQRLDRRKVRRAAFGWGALVSLGLLFSLSPLGLKLERDTLDFRYAKFNRDRAASPRVVVVDIDEQSLKLLAPTYGRWPWPRRVYKDFIEFASIGEPKAIFFDLLFTERSPQPADDAALAEASASIGNVSHAMTLLRDRAEEGSGAFPLPKGFSERYGLRAQVDPAALRTLPRFEDYVAPAEPYLKKVERIHVVTFDEDGDGVSRRAPLLFRYEDAWLPSLALAGARALLPEGAVKLEKNRLLLGDRRDIAIGPDGTFYLHHYRSDRAPQSIPFAAVIASAAKLQRGDVDPAALKVSPLEFHDKVVIIGTSAVGTHDLKTTPVLASFPGAVIQASAISNLVDGDFLRPVPFAVRAMALALLLAILYASVFFLQGWAPKLLVPVAAFALYSTFAIASFQQWSLWWDLFVPAVVSALAVVDGFAYLAFVEGVERRKLQGTLSKYVSPSVTQAILASGTDPRAEVGRHEELSVLFSDIRGFTTLSESMPPGDLVARLNEYLGAMTGAVFARSGTLDKFIGDAVMAFWGAPLHDEQHAANAVRCAFAMKAELKRLNEEWNRNAKRPFELEMGIGINSGRVIVGNIGSEKRLEYTVIGDNVNLASRIEGLTKQYGCELLIGERTEELIRGAFVCRPVELRVRVKGKLKYVKLYEPLCERSAVDAEEYIAFAERFTRALALFERGGFEEALKEFRSMQRRVGGDGPSALYAERCEELIRRPPALWDGSYVASTK